MQPPPESSEQNALPSTARVVRLVMLSQMLFAAGNSLTTGGFFNYFIHEFAPSALFLSVLMMAPETSQSLSVCARWIALRIRSRKRVWLVSLFASRLIAMLIPAALLWPASRTIQVPLLFILFCTIGWYILQGIAYVTLISWLSDLVPEIRWGRLFSRRQLASLLVALGVPIGAVLLRDQLLDQLPESARNWSYAVIFLLGGMLTLASALPLLSLPDVPWRQQSTGPSRSGWLQSVFHNRSLRALLGMRWWLAFFQGLTQSVFFLYAVDQLDMSLLTYLLLVSTMLLVQLPMTLLGGALSDRNRDLWGLCWGLILVGLAVPFWMLSTPAHWQLIIPAYLLWGCFGLVNVCGQNLCLKLSPVGDNAGQFALYESFSGLIAGAAGLLGGSCLDWLLAQDASPQELTPRVAYLILFAVSTIGRLSAPLWLLGLRQPDASAGHASRESPLTETTAEHTSFAAPEENC